MRSRKSVRIALVVLGIVLLLVLAAVLLLPPRDKSAAYTPTAPSFVGDSTELKATVILPTLDSPIPPGRNAIWCASFVAAWKTLESEVAKEPIGLTDPPPVLKLLNSARDPRPDIPPESLYVAAGWNDKGIMDKIRRDLAARFPAKAMPTFPGAQPDSLIAYGYLEANVRFAIPYFQWREPFVFTDGNGGEHNVASFGIRREDHSVYRNLRAQANVLYRGPFESPMALEYAIDLDRNSDPSQIIVAVIEPKPTLAETLQSLDEKIASAAGQWPHGEVGPNDELLVPDIWWSVAHRLKEIEGHSFTNAVLRKQPIIFAQQDIFFRLDRSGAELRSESRLVAASMSALYYFNRPFLICMKKRGAKDPYFVMWVDNAELLQPWPADRK